MKTHNKCNKKQPILILLEMAANSLHPPTRLSSRIVLPMKSKLSRLIIVYAWGII